MTIEDIAHRAVSSLFLGLHTFYAAEKDGSWICKNCNTPVIPISWRLTKSSEMKLGLVSPSSFWACTTYRCCESFYYVELK